MFKGMQVSRADSVRHPSNVLVCNVSTHHVHLATSVALESVEMWLGNVEHRLPLGMLTGAVREVPIATTLENVKLNPEGLVLLRVGKTKFMREGKFQLLIQLDNDSITSCPSDKSGQVQDLFLLSLKDVKDIANAQINIHVVPINGVDARVNAKVKSFKAKATGLLKLGKERTDSRATIITHPEEDQEDFLSIPLSALLNDPNRELAGCFPLDGGVIGLHLCLSQNALTTMTLSSKDLVVNQQYLTIQKGHHHWQRTFAVLKGQSLQIHDHRRHTQKLSNISLETVVGIHFHPVHACGIDNVLNIVFENGTELAAYADDEQQGLNWADAVHLVGGPTGIGKTDLAVLLAQRLDGELISCDSVQVYAGLEIGANKTPTPVIQHMLDVVGWKENFTAADFVERCWKIIGKVVERGKIPILVGGTGLYLDWMLNGRPGAPPTDPTALAAIEEEIGKEDWDTAYSRLQLVDPEYAKVILKNDYYRLKRALVVYRQTGRPLSAFKNRQSGELKIDWRCLYLTHGDRFALLQHLDRRCEMMVQKGLVAEVSKLQMEGFNTDYQAGRAIGYKETLDFLEKLQLSHHPRDDLIVDDELIVEYLKEFKSQTRQYTRRQEKWFYGMKEFHWLERKSLIDDLSKELVDQAVSLCQISESDYQNPQLPIISQCALFREQCRAPELNKTSRRRLQTYTSQLTIYSTSELRKTIIEEMVNGK